MSSGSPARVVRLVLLVGMGLGAARLSAAQPKPSSAPSANPAPGPSAKPIATPAGSASAKLSATPYDEDTRDPRTRALARYNDGIDFATKKDWTRAYHAFLAAWTLVQTVKVALNLGKAELETVRYGDAALHLQYCIDNTKPGDGNGALARTWIVEAQKKAAKLTVKAPDGARLFVDGVLAGKAPLREPLFLNPGVHTVEARLGVSRAQRAFEVDTEAALSVELHVPLEPTPVPTAASSTQEAPSLITGRPLIIAGGLTIGVAGTVVGIVAAALAQDLNATQNGECLRRRDPYGKDCWNDRRVEKANLARLSAGGFIGGGVFALAAGAYWLFGAPRDGGGSPGKKSDAGLVVTPLASPTSAGVGISGNW